MGGLCRGIFLGAGLLHMLADAVQSLQNFSYPVAELACALGYVMVLTIDAVIMPTLSRHLVARAAVRSRASLGDMAVGSLVAGLPTVRSLLLETQPSRACERLEITACRE